MSRFSDEQIRYARGRVRFFATEWYSETPAKLHRNSRTFSDDGAPELTTDFRSYLDEALISKRREGRPRGPHDTYSPRRRVTDAFRTLRARAPREYDVMACLVVVDRVGLTTGPEDDALERQFSAGLEATARRLNQRALRTGRSELWTPDDVLTLVISAVSKLDMWAS